ncbi:MAG: class I SAM-dependent methyltransferase [Saprospiraceae bacterium]
MTTNAASRQVDTIKNYYRFQSSIYDLTRWTFLFGRKAVIQELPFEPEETFHLLEIGCGTGYNLIRAAKQYPEARFKGMDVSTDMLGIAKERLAAIRRRVVLLNKPYEPAFYTWTGKLDAILFSYSLTMINPQWESLIIQAYKDLKPGGYIAVADFHDSRFPFFKRHMAGHHVRMDAHLLPVLQENFKTEVLEVQRAWFGLWHYVVFIGRKI